MIESDKYSDLNKIDESEISRRLYDTYIALSFLQNNMRTIKADDFSVACLLNISPKQVQEKKKLLYDNGFINYNTSEKLEIIKKCRIIADSDLIQIL